MTRRQKEALLDHFVKAVPAAVRKAGLMPNACILSTRLGVEGLRAHGIRAQAMPVSLRVFNTAAWELVEAQERDVATWEAANAWSVGLGFGGDRTGWNGHLVAIADGRYLVDLSAAQVQRLRYDINAEAFWTEARDLARGQPQAFRGDDGCVWLYEPTPANRDYLRAPAWAAYRVTVKGGHVVSERHGPAAEPVATRVAVPL